MSPNADGLRELQRAFHKAVLSGDEGMRARIVGTAKADAATRLNIYADAYRLRLLEVLESDYPGLHTMVGDEAMDEIGRAYIDAHPSQHPSVRWFGEHMARFLRATAPYTEQPILAEMASFEWAQNAVFDATEVSAVSIAEVAAIAPEQWGDMRPRLHPSVHRLDLAWNVPTVWLAIEKEESPPEIEEYPHPLSWLLWRADYDIHWRSIEVDEACAIDVCLNGGSFGEICELLCEWHATEQAPAQAAGLLKRWVTDNLVVAVELD